MPAYDSGRVYALDTVNSVHAYDAATGAHLWATTPISPRNGVHYSAVGLVADAGVVYARDGSFLRAIDGTTGTQLWRSTVSNSSDHSDDVPTLTPDSVVFVGTSGTTISLDRATGATRWVDHGCCYGGSAAEAAYSNGRLYAVQDGDAPSRVVDAATGTTLAEVAFDGIPAVAPERLVVRRAGNVVSLDPATYATQWTFDPPVDGYLTPPVVTPGRVFAGAGTMLYALDRATGAVQSSLDVGAAFTPRVKNNILQIQGVRSPTRRPS